MPLENRLKLAVLMSHPIQYQVPLLRRLATSSIIDPTVLFFWDFGVKATHDAQFGRVVQWDIPLLDGYRYRFLKNHSPRPYSDFWGQINPAVIREILSGGYDAVLGYGWNSLSNWMAYATAWWIGLPVILQGESTERQEELKPAWLRFLKRVILGKTLFRLVDAFLYIGTENRIFYEKLGVPSTKLFHAPYSVDNERFLQEHRKLRAHRKALRRKIAPEAGDGPIILFVGKLIEKKRPLDLLTAYASLARRDKALVFVGDGPLRTELEALISTNAIPGVRLPGFRNQTELASFYTAADIFVLPSGPGETWGLVVNEAMCFGLPVVVSDMAGCARDLVKSGENGFVFPVGDRESIATHLSRLANDDQLRRSCGEKSLDIIKSYDQAATVTSLSNAVKTLALTGH